MKVICHYRRWILALLGVLLLVPFIVKLMQPIVPGVGQPDTEVGETVSQVEYASLHLDKDCYTVKEIEKGSVVLTIRNNWKFYFSCKSPARIQISQDGVWHNLKFLYGYWPYRPETLAVRKRQPENIDIGLSQYGETLTPGHYRVCVNIGSGLDSSIDTILSVEFDVVK